MLGALNARTLVVDRSSSGADIALRLMVPALLMLAARLGSKRTESDTFLLRLVSARASSMATWLIDTDGDWVELKFEIGSTRSVWPSCDRCSGDDGDLRRRLKWDARCDLF